MLGLVLILATSKSALDLDQGGASQEESVKRAPQRLTGPDDWQKLESLTSTARTEVMLNWLVEERREPTPTFTGFGGAPIDTHYMQAQIVHSLGGGDPRVLRWLAESKEVKPPTMRDMIGLALALSGELKAKPYVLKALAESENPWLREKAASFLIEWPGKETITALEAAADDPFRIKYERTIDGAGPVDKYPVRDAVKHSLAVIARGTKPNEWSRKWQEGFRANMQGYDVFVRDRATDLKRIVATINKDTAEN